MDIEKLGIFRILLEWHRRHPYMDVEALWSPRRVRESYRELPFMGTHTHGETDAPETYTIDARADQIP
jgi:hypothetical protein